MTKSGNSSTRFNLLSQSQGAKIIFATDEWFASACNLLNDNPPTFVPDLYSEQGKVMDGWETRRKRTPGHDWCLISLAWSSSSSNSPNFQKLIDCLEVDTAYFTGNHVPRISVQIGSFPGDEGKLWEKQFPRGGGGQGLCATIEEIKHAEALFSKINPSKWIDILPMTPLNPGYEETRYHSFDISPEISKHLRYATHIRVNYFPDGGVARLRLWADISKTQKSVLSQSKLSDSSDVFNNELIDVACSTNGGRGVGCSNRHYGVPENLIKPTTGKDMGDGWETARHPDRPPVLQLLPRDVNSQGLCDFSNLMDWCVLALGSTCSDGIKQIIVDTKHFKGNFPESVMIEACFCPPTLKHMITSETEQKFLCRPPGADFEVGWFEVLQRTKLSADKEHFFSTDKISNSTKPATHVRVTIWPDGGLSRVRIFGKRNVNLPRRSQL